jgi:hypothetical protein
MYVVREWRHFMAQDACHMIAYEVGDLYRRVGSPSQDDVDGVILGLHRNSVINLRVSAEGKPLDPFGTPFRIRFTREGSKSTTQVTSAGSDGRFDTPDDLGYTDTRSDSN